MSVAGFDIGNASSCVAVARRGGVDVLMNRESKRESPTVVSFNSKTRFMSTDAVSSLSINPKNTVTQLKRLVGKQWGDEALQKDMAELPFKLKEGPGGKVVVEVMYLDQPTTFTPEQLIAMMLVDQKDVAMKETGGPITDCVLSVPVFFTEAERYAMLSAAQIAGLNCLRLMNETTALALAYGIYKTDLPEAEPVKVAFVDIAHSALQVSVVALKKGQLQVLAHAFDRDLGGRNFDQVLFDHFAAEFQERYKDDVRTSARASFRLRLACEKLKKILSANSEAPLNVECLMNDVDFTSSMTRDKFEEMAAPLIERVKVPLEQALSLAGVKVEELSSVEVVGSASRVPAVQRVLRDFFGKEPSKTLNAKEAVSRGCALQCAMLSPIFRVRDFEVIDAFPYGVSVTWEKDGEATTSVLFERGCAVPSAKMLTFFRAQPFSIRAQYTPESPLPPGFNPTIGTFHVSAPKLAEGQEKAKLKVKVRLNLHSVVSVESVQQIEEEEYEEVAAAPTVEEPAAAAAGEGAAKGDEPMAEAGADAPPADDAATNGEAKAAEAGGGEPMEAEAAVGPTPAPDAAAAKVVKKKRVRKVAVEYTTETAAPSSAELAALFEAECELALQAKVQEETNERKNAVEEYVYSLRNKLSDGLAPFVSESDKAAALAQLEATEEWLYEEGEDQPKKVYVAKLEELKAMGDPIEARYQESLTRDAAASALLATCAAYKSAVGGEDPKHAHLQQADRDAVISECDKAMQWLQEKQGLQASLKPYEEPVLTTADIKKKEEVVGRVANPILAKQPPAPPAKKEEAMETDAAAADAGAAGEEGGEGEAGATDMEAEKSEA